MSCAVLYSFTFPYNSACKSKNTPFGVLRKVFTAKTTGREEKERKEKERKRVKKERKQHPQIVATSPTTELDD
jgi:hypothetical protein